VWVCVLLFWILRLQPSPTQQSERKTGRLRSLVTRRVPQ
jgi:hypothetical protein